MYVYGLFLFTCLEIENNLAGYKVIFSMNMSRSYCSDDCSFVSEIRAAMTQFRLIARLI